MAKPTFRFYWHWALRSSPAQLWPYVADTSRFDEATGFPVMVICLTSVVLGGVRHPLGAVLGAAVAICLPELFRGLEAA